MKDDNNFLSFSDFTERYDIETNFLTFQGVISAVKSLWKSNEANLHNDNAIYKSFIDTFLKTKKPNRPAYKILVSKKQKRPITAQRKWVTDCMLETQENIDWKTVYWTPFLCTKITKLIVFRFKLLHRRLATNSFLTKINLKDNEQCTFCQNDRLSSTFSGLVRYPFFFGKVLSNGQSTEENFQILLIYPHNWY